MSEMADAAMADDEKPGALRLRQRHVLCAVGFEPVEGIRAFGHGDAMISNMARIVREQLRAPGGEAVMVTIADSADSFCAPCAYRVGRDCRMQGRALRIDAAHGETLGIAPGDRMAWGALLGRVRDRVAADDLDIICEGCPWLPFDVCKRGVSRLRDRPAASV